MQTGLPYLPRKNYLNSVALCATLLLANLALPDVSLAAYTEIWSDGFNGSIANWTVVAGYVYATGLNHGSYTGAGGAYADGNSAAQLWRSVGSRPFGECHVSAWYSDPSGGWRMTCGSKQSEGLRLAYDDTAAMMLDYGLYSPLAAGYYYFRTVGGSGIPWTLSTTRYSPTVCSPAWIQYEITVTPGNPGATPVGTVTFKATDPGIPYSATQNLTTDFYSYGVGRVCLGFNLPSTTGQRNWDDIKLEATQPGAPTIGNPSSISTSGITWNWTRADNNLFGFDIGDSGGTIKAPQYPTTGWLARGATSWAETGLTPNSQYTRKVLAWNGSLNSPYSSTVSKYTLQTAATSPTFGTITMNSIVLNTTGPVNLTSGSSGVIFKRNGSTDLTSVQALATTDTGLSANTQYSYTARGVNGDGTATTESSSATMWTLSTPPSASTVTPSTAFQCSPGSPTTWTAIGSFGAGSIQYYRYVWDQNATHIWAETETQWSSGTLNTTPTSAGCWYLHIKGYNGGGVGNGTLDYKVVVAQGAEKWTGGNGNWDPSSTGLWQDSVTNPVTYCEGRNVMFDDSAADTSPSITLNTAVFPSSVTNNSTKNYTISGSGAISGTASLTKMGSSILTLSSANTYSGNTTISAGTLALSGSGSIANSPTNIVSSGATFDVSTVIGGFHATSGQTMTGMGTIKGPVTIDSGACLSAGAGATLGTLTVSNNLTLSGYANFRISKSGSTLTSDQVAGISTRANGGTLNVAVVSGSDPLDDGDTFSLFSEAANTGVFAVTNLPSVGAGTNWWTTNNYGMIVLNVWPTANGVSYCRSQGMNLKIKIADLLTNVTGHAVGKIIRLSCVGASTNSATITTNGAFILYNPGAGNHNDEYISYTAADGRGGAPSANIHISVSKWTSSPQTITVTNNQVALNFAGIPNCSYAIQRATDLQGVWTTLVTTNAPAAGLFSWVDDFRDLGAPPASAYYRLQQP